MIIAEDKKNYIKLEYDYYYYYPQNRIKKPLINSIDKPFITHI